MTFSVCIPTLNVADNWSSLVGELRSQSAAPAEVLIIDSCSEDETATLAIEAGFRTHVIGRERFNHGATRQLGVSILSQADIIVFLTQDAILAGADSLANILAAFDDPEVAAAYGRQLPRPGAGPIEAHARQFNYPPQSEIRSLADRERLGFKTIFISNSFAAYRRKVLEQVGGFPDNIIIGEDTYVAAKMLLAGWKIAYVAEATVFHSHEYSYWQEFKRYFDTGAFHAQQPWLKEEFGGTSEEGSRFVFSELRTVWRSQFWLIPAALLRTAIKFVGYRTGRLEKWLSVGLKLRLSMHKGYWVTTGSKNEQYHTESPRY